MAWIDVSMPLRNGMPVWPGDDPVAITPAGRIANGAVCNTSRLSMPSHVGTHVDAPWHFEDDGKRLHEVDTEVFFGEALVIEMPDSVGLITAAHLPAGELPERVLVKTRNSAIPIDAPFQEDFVAVDESAAKVLVERGVRLIGIDYLSIAAFGNGVPTHRVLLSKDVFIVEGLRLADIPAGPCEFVVLPIPLHGLDGAPARAFLRR